MYNVTSNEDSLLITSVNVQRVLLPNYIKSSFNFLLKIENENSSSSLPYRYRTGNINFTRALLSRVTTHNLDFQTSHKSGCQTVVLNHVENKGYGIYPDV